MKFYKLGMTWYKREDYERLKQLFIDGDMLPTTYDEWLEKAENGFAQLIRGGNIVVKAYINPDTFPKWCDARRLSTDTDGRKRFASEFAARPDIN